MLPFPYWDAYITSPARPPVYAHILLSIYVGIKLLGLVQVLKAIAASLHTSFSQSPTYGIRIDVASLEDPMCPVCQDTARAPVQLPCRHAFCEDCIDRWLERERTCPLCRAVVPDAGLQAIPVIGRTLFFLF
jgi:hypothetical protein